MVMFILDRLNSPKPFSYACNLKRSRVAPLRQYEWWGQRMNSCLEGCCIVGRRSRSAITLWMDVDPVHNSLCFYLSHHCFWKQNYPHQYSIIKFHYDLGAKFIFAHSFHDSRNFSLWNLRNRQTTQTLGIYYKNFELRNIIIMPST